MIIHINGVDREATKDEAAEIEATRAESKALKEFELAELANKDAKRQAVISKLGLTPDEVAALLS
jgi:hypothetical protein